MMNGTPPFAQLVHQLRLQRGLSQNQLAHAAHLSRVYVYHLETGQRQNPSDRVVQQLARTLRLSPRERQQVYTAFTHLTGRVIDEEPPAELPQRQMRSLAHLLVANSTYPTHALDHFWYVHHWNQAALDLFEITKDQRNMERLLLVELVFGAQRPQFLAWEQVAQELVNAFLYTTRALTHLPAYQDLWRRLRALPDFRRLVAACLRRRPRSPGCLPCAIASLDT
jgi:transcriptional regulator with XRE-family HTH domain